MKEQHIPHELQLPEVRSDILQHSADELEGVLADTVNKFRDGRLDEVRADLDIAQQIHAGAVTQLTVLETLGRADVDPNRFRELVMGEPATLQAEGEGDSEEDDQTGNIREQAIRDLTDHQYNIAQAAFAIDPKTGEYVHPTFDDIAKAAFAESYAKLSSKSSQEKWLVASRNALTHQTRLLMGKLTWVEEHPKAEHPDRVLEMYDSIRTQPEFAELSLDELELVALRGLSMEDVKDRLHESLARSAQFQI